MMFIPRDQYEKMQEFNKEMRNKIINSDPGFKAIIKTMYESPDFKTYPQHQQDFVTSFMEILNDKNNEK